MVHALHRHAAGCVVSGDDTHPPDDGGGVAEVVQLRPDGARGYSWPPFEKGNQVGLRHGAWSPAIVEPLAAEIIDAVRPTVSWWTAADEPAVHSWARTEARIQRITQWLEQRGSELDEDGEAVGAANMLTRLEKQAESLRSKLGLDPLSRSRLGANVAGAQVDMARLMAEEAQRDGAP
jgi:hypothetical protein